MRPYCMAPINTHNAGAAVHVSFVAVKDSRPVLQKQYVGEHPTGCRRECQRHDVVTDEISHKSPLLVSGIESINLASSPAETSSLRLCLRAVSSPLPIRRRIVRVEHFSMRAASESV